MDPVAAASMLENGWTPEELADIGIGARCTAGLARQDGEAAR